MPPEESEANLSSRWSGVFWSAATAAVVVVAALVPLATAPRYYFNDDTQIGAFGIWFRIGELLRGGPIPFIEPSTWAAGNYWVEGQWGLLNPVVLAIGWFARLSSDAVVFSTVVKVAFLALCAVGVRGLARSYGATDVFAFLAGSAVPLAGFTFYVDATTWVTGLFVFTFIAWFWWGLRAIAFGKTRTLTVLGAVTAGYLVVTVGYVHGTIALVAILGVTLLDVAVARRRHAALLVGAIGLVLGLVAVAVYMPAVLTSAVTARSGTGIANDGFLVADLSGLASSAISTALPQVSAWWGATATVPMLYISWALPAVAFVNIIAAKAVGRRLLGLGVFLLFMVLWICGPSYVGPLRTPVRMTPYVALAAVVGLAVLLSRAAARPTVTRGVIFCALVAISAYFALAQVPSWRTPVVASAAICLIGGATIALRLWGPGRRAWRWTAVVVFGSLAVCTSAVQHRAVPLPPLADYQLPSSIVAYQNLLSSAEGDVFVAGPTSGAPVPSIWYESSLGNQWYLTLHPVQNVYSPIGYEAYLQRFCMNNRGEACADSLATMIGVEPTTGIARADLMGVSTIQVVRSAYPEGIPEIPTGWHIAEEGEQVQTWTRDVPVPTAGGVTWASEGLRVTMQDVSEDRTVVRIDQVGPDGGKLVLSRLAWPGYSVEGGSVGEPTDGYLLTVEVPADAGGSSLAIEFRPTGWNAAMASLAFAALVLVALLLGIRWRRPGGAELE